MNRRRPSLRLRITAAALVLIVFSLCAAGVIVIGVVEHSMIRQIDSALEADADFANRSVTGGYGLPTAVGPSDLYVQFIGPTGEVIGAGTAAKGLPALAPPLRGKATTIVSTVPASPGAR